MAIFSNPNKFLTVTGVNAFVGDVIRDITTMPHRLDKIAEDFAHRVQRDAKKRAPYDPNRRKPGPHLRDTIVVEKIDDGIYEVGPTAPYGHIIEFGSVRQAPQPYMLPALDRNAERFRIAVVKIAGEF